MVMNNEITISYLTEIKQDLWNGKIIPAWTLLKWLIKELKDELQETDK